jgi:hypothetical protein
MCERSFTLSAPDTRQGAEQRPARGSSDAPHVAHPGPPRGGALKNCHVRETEDGADAKRRIAATPRLIFPSFMICLRQVTRLHRTILYLKGLGPHAKNHDLRRRAIRNNLAVCPTIQYNSKSKDGLDVFL